jgi:chromosome segregation ATPase
MGNSDHELATENMNANESFTDPDSTAWPEMSTDLSLARSVARAITLDTNRASSDTRVSELSSQVHDVNGRLLEVEKMVADQRSNNVVVQRVTEQLSDLRVKIDSTNAELANEVGAAAAQEAQASVTQVESRVSKIETAQMKDADELSSLMSYLEEAFQRLDGLSQEVDALASPAATAQLEAKISSFDGALIELRSELETSTVIVDDRVAQAEAKIAADVSEVQSRLQEQVTAAEDYLASEVASVQDHLRTQVSDSEQQLAEQVADARSFLIERLDNQDAEITDRLSDIPGLDRLEALESNGSAADETVNALSSDVADLQSRTAELHVSAEDTEKRFDLNSSAIAAQAEEISLVAEQVDLHHAELTERITANEDRANELVANTDERINAIDGRISNLDEHITGTGEHLASTVERMTTVDNRLSSVDDHIASVDDHIAIVDDRVAAVDERVSAVDERMTSVDERISDIGSQLSNVAGTVETTEALNERIQSLAHDAELTNETAGRVSYLSERMAELTAQTDNSDTKIHQLDGRLVDASLQIETFDSRIGSVESTLTEVVEEGVNHVSDLADRFVDLDDEVKTNSAKLRTTQGRIDDVAGKADQALEHASGTDAKIVELRRRTIAAHDRIDDTIQQVTELRTHTAKVTEQAELATDAADSIGDAAMRIAEAEVIITSVQGQSATALQRADDAHRRIESLGVADHVEEQIETVSLLISEHVEEQLLTNEDLVRRVEEAAQRAAESSDIAVSAKTASDVATSRADDAHVQIDSLTALVDSLRDELAESASGELDAGVAERLDELEDQLAKIDVRVADATTMSGHTLDRFDETADQIVNLQQTSATALTRASEATEQLKRLNETVGRTELPTDLLERVDAIEKACEHHANYVDPSVDERINEAESQLITRIDEARAELARQAAESEQRLAENVARVEGELATQVADARSVLTESVSDAQVQLDEQIFIEDPDGAAKQSLASIREQASSARQVADEAYQFSENLRVLQTDLVKAIQQELRRQSTRLTELETDGRHSSRFADLEHQVDDIAASVTTLTELQGRSTNLDSTLTESVTHMTKSVEDGRSEVDELKAGLAAALQRIESLEAAPAATPAVDTTSESTQQDGEDDWFTESVTKKEKKKRFGK